MSGQGSPQQEAVDAADLRVAVVAARWHQQITDALLASALRTLSECRVEEPAVVRVPGAFELPVTAQALAGQRHDVVVCLGVVIRGGTPHFEYVCRAATDGLLRVSLDTGVPIGFGLLTCETELQALDRCGLPSSHEDKGREAVLAALDTALALRAVRRGERPPGGG